MKQNGSQPDLSGLANTPEATRLLRNKQALQQLLTSPESRQLLALLQREGGEHLQQAAQAALKGDGSQLSRLMDRVTSTREGAQAAQKLRSSVERQK